VAKIGVLSLQGDFAEHIQALQSQCIAGVEVRLPKDLDTVDALIIPGGESTTISLLMDLYQIAQPLKERVYAGMPVWGTCAGMIILAKKLTDDRPQPLGLLDMVVSRNAFGGQLESFQEDIEVPVLGGNPFPAVFIRAPIILEAGTDVEILARLSDGTTVAARQGNVLATAFHPELTSDPRFHAYFASWIQ
jgi:5'-phosphate synthase pdxT subunit